MSKEFNELIAQLEDCGCEARSVTAAKTASVRRCSIDFSGLLDYEITDADAARLVKHSANCPTCESRIEEEIVFRKVIRRGCCGNLRLSHCG